MRGDGRGRSRGAEVVLGAARRTGPERGVHREMVKDVGVLGRYRVSEDVLGL